MKSRRKLILSLPLLIVLMIVTAGVVYASTVGAGAFSTISGGQNNEANGDFSSVGGGDTNIADGRGSTIAGGRKNQARGTDSTIGGGSLNKARAGQSTISGGKANLATGQYAAVSGGSKNTASGNYAIVAGGEDNIASGGNSFAGGQRAHAAHDGTFVWADATGADLSSTGPNQFIIRASGGVGINSDPLGEELHIVETPGSPDSEILFEYTGSGGGTPGLFNLGVQDDGKLSIKTWPAHLRALTVDGDGNVGIGTTSPQARLQVEAPPGSNGLWVRAGDIEGDVLFHVEDSDGSVQAIHVDAGGRVGIGNTNPTRRLDVNGFFRQTNGHMLFSDGLENAVFVVQDGTHPDDGRPNRFVFRSVPDLDAYDASQATLDMMTIENDGNVGIGTISPGSTLQVGQGVAGDDTDYGISVFRNGEGENPGTYDAGSPALDIRDLSGAGPSSLDPDGIVTIHADRISENTPNAHNATILSVQNDNGSGLRIDGRGNSFLGYYGQTNSTDVSSLFVEGKVGIGTTSPNSALQVSGYVQLDLTAGAPPAADCDEAAEAGRMKFDDSVDILFICSGASGWVTK